MSDRIKTDTLAKLHDGVCRTHEPMHVPEQPVLSPLQQAWRNRKELCEGPVYEDVVVFSNSKFLTKGSDTSSTASCAWPLVLIAEAEFSARCPEELRTDAKAG